MIDTQNTILIEVRVCETTYAYQLGILAKSIKFEMIYVTFITLPKVQEWEKQSRFSLEPQG